MFGVINMSITSFFGGLFGGNGSNTVEAAGNALDNLFTSDDERNQAKLLFEKLKQQPAALQVELNKIEATHRSVFVAGWRPAIGWVCAAALFTYFVPQFILGTIVWVMTIHTLGWTEIPPYPVNANSLFELVLAMLGMATLRTIEKAKDLTK